MLGFARWSLDDASYRDLTWAGIQGICGLGLSQETWDNFVPRLHYQSGNRTYLEDFQKLKDRLDDLDLSEGEDSNRLNYLSVSPDYFVAAVENLLAVGACRQQRRLTQGRD